MECKHNYQFYGEKVYLDQNHNVMTDLEIQAAKEYGLLNDAIWPTNWLCYQCCGILIYSGLAKRHVLVEYCPEQQEYCSEELEIHIAAVRKTGHDIPLDCS